MSDEGDIIAGTEYDNPVPCWRRHPGVYCTQDADILQDITSAHDVIISKVHRGSVYKFTGTFQDGSSSSAYAH